MTKTTKLFLVICSLIFNVTALAQNTVPAIGSEWVSTLTYKTSGVSKNPETLRVEKYEDGVPIFKGEAFGYEGTIRETSVGTIVYTEDCLPQVEEEFVAPKIANQCGWHVCNAPEVGKTFERKMFIYVPLLFCSRQEGVYKATTLEVNFGPMRSTSWTSHIRDGEGEIFAESPGRVTAYSKVNVSQSVYIPTFITAKNSKNKVIENIGLTNSFGESFTSSDGLIWNKTLKTKNCQNIALGDSLTEGMGVKPYEAYPAKLAKLVGENVCNLGGSGQTSKQLLERLPEVLALKPKRVFFFGGANDIFQGNDLRETVLTIKKIVKTLEDHQIEVVLGVFEENLGKLTLGAALKDLNALESPNVKIATPLNGVWGKHMSGDGVHPNPSGHQKMAENFYVALKLR